MMGVEKFWVLKIQLGKIFGCEKFSVLKNFGSQQILGPEKFWIRKILGAKNFRSRKNLGPEKFWFLKNFGC